MSNLTNNLAHLSPERRREIASLGGKAAHAKGTAHVFSSEEARVAGSKGGQVRAAKAAKRAPHFLSPAENTALARKAMKGGK